jgi:putative oxidoreductase
MSQNSARSMSVVSSPYISLVLRLLVGGVLIVSAVTKLPLHSQFVGIVESFNLLPQPLAEAYALTLPWVELLTGSYLTLGILLRPSAAVTILMGISFMVANVSAIVQGEQFCASCFGEAFPLLVSQALALDVFIIIAASLLFMVGGRKQFLGFDTWFMARKLRRARGPSS